MDDMTPSQRRENMRKIRGKDTKSEIILRKALWHRGYRYRKNWVKLPGKPDIVLTKQRICIFVDSEYFHGKGFEGSYQSKKYESLKEQIEHSNNSSYWMKKIIGNMDRDRKVDAELRGSGWVVLHFWSREVLKDPEACIKAIEETIFQEKLML